MRPRARQVTGKCQALPGRHRVWGPAWVLFSVSLCLGPLVPEAVGLDLGVLRKQVTEAMDAGDLSGALKFIETARQEQGLTAVDQAELTLIEAESREDGAKALGLLQGLAADESLPPALRGRAEKALGFRYYLMEKCAEALPRLAKAQEILPVGDPSTLEAAYFEGSCALETGDFDRARRAYALSLKGDASLSVWSAVGLAEVDLKAGKAAEAQKAFRKLFESPEGASYRGFLLAREAECARRQGKEDEARALWNRVLAEFPDSVAALEAREKLREVPSVPGAAFTLRAGAFSTEDRAKTQVEFLKKVGFQSRIVKKTDGSKAPFKVWVGSFGDRAAAEKELKKIEQETGIRCQVVETE